MEFLIPEMSGSLFRAPHTNGKLLTAAALCNFSLYHSCHVYIPHVLTKKAEQIEHVNLSSLQPVIQFASTGFLPILKGCYSMLTDCSSSVYISISFFTQSHTQQSIGEASSMPTKHVESISSVTSSCVGTDLLGLKSSALTAPSAHK